MESQFISPIFGKSEIKNRWEGENAGKPVREREGTEKYQRKQPVPETGKPGKDDKRGYAGFSFKGKILEGYNLKELFSVCAAAFTIPKLLTASAGVVLGIFLFPLFEMLETSLVGGLSSPLDANLRSLLNLFPLSLIFFVFIISSSLISRMTLERIFFNRGLTLASLMGFTGRIIIPVFINNIFILVLVNTLISLSGNIPVVGPVVYSLLFLPLYLLSLAILLTVCFGFWFYPPVIAYRNAGITENVRNFFFFLRKHNFTLLYIIPVLAMIISVVFSIVYYFHMGAISLSFLFTDGSGGNSVSGAFASVPSNLLRISELSFFGTGMGRFKELVSGLMFSQQAGGFIIGLVLVFLTLLIFSSFISVVSTLSTHVYVLMERGVDVDDGKKLRLLGILVFLLAGIIMVRKLFL